MRTTSRTIDGHASRPRSSGAWRAIRSWPGTPCDAQRARADVLEPGPAPGRPGIVQLLLAGCVAALLVVALVS